MKIKWINFFLLIISINSCVKVSARIHFQRLTAGDVYKALRDAGRMDAVPEGRVITQGIAAATGFVAGVVKGAAIPLLISFAFGNRGHTNTSSQTTTQEICFSSRSLNEIEDGNGDGGDSDDDDEAEGEGEGENVDIPEAEGRQTTTGIAQTTNPTQTGTSPTGETPTPPATTDTTGLGTPPDTGTGTTETTTDSGSGGPVNCIVVQKPANS